MIKVKGGHCQKCNKRMVWRKHQFNPDYEKREKYWKKILEKPYYFKRWHYCPNCSFVQHYEKYKVYN